MTVGELFDRCGELAAIEPSHRALHYLHETLVLACAEALRGSRQAFGNVFSQVDYLCKHHGVAMRERIAIQQMRRHSNNRKRTTSQQEQLSQEDWLYDVRALAIFISSVFHTDIPHGLLTRLPANGRQQEYSPINQSYIRCIVDSWDDSHIYATTAEGPICVDISSQLSPLTDHLSEGMQLNLLDCHREGTTVKAGLVVVEPDFLVDISAIAACFQDYGHHPMSYLFSRLKARGNTQAILLGNFAGTALDDLIHHPDTSFADTLRRSFSEQVLQFCTCEGFDGAHFKTDALQQEANIREAVEVLFGTHEPVAMANGLRVDDTYDIQRALVEPSFVCERLGLQGRVDLMTDDMKLLVEQKSGKNWNIERLMQQLPPVGPYPYQEAHYVQLLLYYGVLRYNFQLSADKVDIRLLYSKYPARHGLLVVNFFQQLFREAMQVRNSIVAQEIRMAREGFSSIMPQLRPSILLEREEKADFFNRYIRGPLEQITAPLHRLSDEERSYVERLFTFVYREQLAQKTGVQEGQGGAQADLWNMPLSVKQETGSILMGPLATHDAEQVTLHIDTTQVLPNFRRGDMVYLYRCDGEPDVCGSILYKGVIAQLTDTLLTVRLNERQENNTVFGEGDYAVEHASSDIGTTSALRSIHAFCCASADKRQLLLGLRAPRRDTSLSLSHSYHPHYDEMLLKAKQAQDYFLLQGPPGTGKTSMALRFLVEEELASLSSHPSPLTSDLSSLTPHLLLTAYTHRAVDEICGMLEEAGISYLRLGSKDSCDPRFVHRLLDRMVDSHPKMDDIRRLIQDMSVIVSTTSTLLSRPFLFQLMHFSLCIVDEASQILDPNMIGLLASDRIQRFILIGDHKQLPAVVQQPDDEPSLHACRQSLFERLLQQERTAGRTDFIAILRRQGRMHPDIAAFPNEFFYAAEHLQPVPLPHQEEAALCYEQPSEDALDDLLKQHRVLFFDSSISGHSGLSGLSELSGEPTLSDKANPTEARMVADLLRRILRQYGPRFDAQKTVGVIVPYRNQIAMIRRELAQLGLPQLNDISIDTVERYQGSQRDVIIYSFTVRHPYQLDFLTANCFDEVADHRTFTIDRKLNVAMTRARKQLLMTGYTPVLAQNPLFAELIRRYSVTT